MQKPKQRIFSERDFMGGTRLDRVYMHLIEPARFHLTLEEEEYLDQIQKVWAVVLEYPIQRERVKMIQAQFDLHVTQIKARINDALSLFGDTFKVNKQLELHVARERYLLMAKKCEEDGDYENAKKCLDKATELIPLLEEFDTPDERVLPGLVFTSDPNALTEGEYVESEDILE